MAGTETQIAMMDAGSDPKPNLEDEADDGTATRLQASKIPAFLSWKLVPTAFIAMMVTWSFGWLYIAATWDPQSYFTNLQIGILNCDSGLNSTYVATLPPSFVNSSIVGQLRQPFASSLTYSLAWNEAAPTYNFFFFLNFSCQKLQDVGYTGVGCGQWAEECHKEARDAVADGRYWNVLFFPANYTMNYLSWYTPTRANPSLAPASTAAISNIYGQGRSYSSYIFINGYLGLIFAGIKDSVFRGVAQAATAFPGIVYPSVYKQPFRLLDENLYPVEFFGQNFGSYVFCILMWLGATFCVAVFNQYLTPAQIKAARGENPTIGEKWAGVGMKAGFALLYTFILAVLLNCIMFSLGKNNTAWHFNPGQSIAFAWWLSWCYVSINAALLFALGPSKFSSVSAFLLVLQLTSGGAIFTEEMSNRFFNIGKGLPFYYGTRAFRTIMFGSTQNWQYINWLVVFAWNVVSVCAAFGLSYFNMFKTAPGINMGSAFPTVTETLDVILTRNVGTQTNLTMFKPLKVHAGLVSVAVSEPEVAFAKQ